MEGIIFIGLQASGKTSFFGRTFAKTHVRLSLDMLKTRHREQILLPACIETRQPVVIDNTNPTAVERARYIHEFRTGRFRVVGYYFQSTLADCLARNSQREGRENIPEAGVRSTYAKLELPSPSEGFDQLYCVTMDGGSFTISEWVDEVHNTPRTTDVRHRYHALS